MCLIWGGDIQYSKIVTKVPYLWSRPNVLCLTKYSVVWFWLSDFFREEAPHFRGKGPKIRLFSSLRDPSWHGASYSCMYLSKMIVLLISNLTLTNLTKRNLNTGTNEESGTSLILQGVTNEVWGEFIFSWNPSTS